MATVSAPRYVTLRGISEDLGRRLALKSAGRRWTYQQLVEQLTNLHDECVALAEHDPHMAEILVALGLDSRRV